MTNATPQRNDGTLRAIGTRKPTRNDGALSTPLYREEFHFLVVRALARRGPRLPSHE
jgi:hypothetical protein